MKNLLLILLLAATLMAASGCIPYTAKEYKVDQKSGQRKLVAQRHYSNSDPLMAEFDAKHQIMSRVAQQMDPNREVDSTKNQWSETAQLAAAEIVGRYYLSTGYGRKDIDSRDGTVVGNVVGRSNGQTTSHISRQQRAALKSALPGFFQKGKHYYWHSVDPHQRVGLTYGEMKLIYKYPHGVLAKMVKQRAAGQD